MFCGRGVQRREVNCARYVNGVLDMIVEEMECTNRGVTRPQDAIRCDEGPCPIYETSEFGPVSVIQVL